MYIFLSLILSLLQICLISAEEEFVALKGNPLLAAYTCNDTKKIQLTFEPNLPPGEENQYTLFITGPFLFHTRIYIKFDSDATVTLSNNTRSVARISNSIDEFLVHFFKPGEEVVMTVKGPDTGVIPYVTSVNVNTVEKCKEPLTGYLDNYIVGEGYTAAIQLTVPDQRCGRRKVQHTELITNGLTSKSGDWPWHAALYRLDKASLNYICGGTLLSKQIVLTAAHCVTIRGEPVLPEIISVVLGKYNLIGGDVAAQEKEVHQITVHKDFAYRQQLDNDIAIMKLKTEIEFNDYIQPACLWYTDAEKKLPSGIVFGTVVGWGFDHTDALSTQLKQALIPKVPEVNCIKSNPTFFGKILNDKKFCAGWNNGTSACNGDSGGGFHVFVPDVSGSTSPNATGAWYIRGIVSLSVSRKDVALCDPNQYVVFTDIAKYDGWIKKYVQ